MRKQKYNYIEASPVKISRSGECDRYLIADNRPVLTLQSCLNSLCVPAPVCPGENAISQNQFLKFPEGFLWGVSTSAFQVEGNPQEAAGRLSDWSRWTARAGKIEDGTNADVACDFLRKYPDDLELSRMLNVNCFRLGLNWPALRPARTRKFALDPETMAYYRKLLESIKSCGMKTFVTLFHFCLPSWLAEIGGWNNPLTVAEFEEFARAVAMELGHAVDYWLTLNEPLVYMYQGYVNGIWPPGYERNYLLAFKTIRRLLEGHAAAYRAIHESVPGAQVSYVIHWRPFLARNGYNPLDQVVRYFRDQVFNHVFPRAVETGDLQFPFPISSEKPIKAISGPIEGLKGSIDFLAFNYFTREICEYKHGWPPDLFGIQSDLSRLATTGMGWEIFPEGLYYLLSEDVAPYRYDGKGQKRPIFITENGMADEFPGHLSDGDWSLTDDGRIDYLISHLVAIHQAIRDGANVKGYLHWSLIDNFEWSDGLTPRFGLVRVAYPTQERALRKSARVFAEIVAANGIEPRRIASDALG